jgi:hypothetical protein
MRRRVLEKDTVSNWRPETLEDLEPNPGRWITLADIVRVCTAHDVDPVQYVESLLAKKRLAK